MRTLWLGVTRANTATSSSTASSFSSVSSSSSVPLTVRPPSTIPSSPAIPSARQPLDGLVELAPGVVVERAGAVGMVPGVAAGQYHLGRALDAQQRGPSVAAQHGVEAAAGLEGQLARAPPRVDLLVNRHVGVGSPIEHGLVGQVGEILAGAGLR